MDTDMINDPEVENAEEAKESLTAKAESIINHLVQQVKSYHEDISKLSKRIEIAESEREIKENLYIRLSEEYKIVIEEKDLIKNELDEMRMKVWDLENKVRQQKEDESSIHSAICTSANAQHPPEMNEKVCQRLKEKEELLKRQLKETSGKYEQTCQENCLLQSKILELNSSIEELKHKHDLEIHLLNERHSELNTKFKTQSRSLLDLEERAKQLSDANVLEQQKYKSKVMELSVDLEHVEIKNTKSEKERESIEIENMKLNNSVKKQEEEISKLKDENRKLIKERGKLAKKIRDLEEPANYDNLLEGTMNVKTMISQFNEFKKKFTKEKEEKEKIEKVMKDCIDKISKTILTENGEVIDWKKKFKLKKLELIHKSQQINDYENRVRQLEKEITHKDIAIQRMIDLGLTEICESKDKLPQFKEIKESFEKMGFLETELRCEKETIVNLQSLIKSRDEELADNNKEVKRLKEKVLELYNKLKNGANHSLLNSCGIESLITQESEIEIGRLNKRILHIEKENRDLISKLSEKQNEYESLIQKSNLASSELQTTKMELIRYQQKCESFNKMLIEKDERVQQLTTERTNMSMKMKELELKHLENQFNESQNSLISNLKAENELFKKILNNSNLNSLSPTNSDIEMLKKKEIDLIRENDKLKQKIYSFKQMIKEYDILLSIFKEKSKENEDNVSYQRLMKFI